jgi:hypothetical protein
VRSSLLVLLALAVVSVCESSCVAELLGYVLALLDDVELGVVLDVLAELNDSDERPVWLKS